MVLKFGRMLGMILLVAFFATGCGQSPFEKLRDATEGKYFESKKQDGKVLVVPLRTTVAAIHETVNDPKMTFLSFVGSVSLNLGPASVTLDADKMKEGLPAWCIGDFEQRTDEEKNICNQLFALALKSEAGKDGKSVEFVEYFPSKHDAALIALSDKIGELLIAKELDAAETAIAKLGKNFRGTDREAIAEWEADVYRAYALALRGDGDGAKRIIERRFLKKNLFNFLLNEKRSGFDAWERSLMLLANFMVKKSPIFSDIAKLTTQGTIEAEPAIFKVCDTNCYYETFNTYNNKLQNLKNNS